jgi:transposase-like protein
MPHPSCPKCKSENVKQIVVWRNASANLTVKESPQSMWACQMCLYRWPRASSVTGKRTWRKQKR